MEDTMKLKSRSLFWALIGLLWLLATVLDRLWWNSYSSVPSWDQADYLNSALDHGRALGFLSGGEWFGWKYLLDLSPKIPPLASLINGTVIAIVGDQPYQAAWSLSLWNGLLMISVASWCISLRGYLMALIATSFVAIAPALVALRTDYVLEIPLTAIVTFALWRLGCWWDPVKGGKWSQAFIAAFALTFSLLVKQSALLVLLPAVLWASFAALRRNDSTKYQLLIGFLLTVGLILPWFKHNWITTIGGTNRAVFESALREGDPSFWTIQNWTWYLKILPAQVGIIFLVVGMSGVLLCLYANRFKISIDGNQAWTWLILNLFASWVFTSLSPNKGDRYFAPILPVLIILLSRGLIEWHIWIIKKSIRRQNFISPIALISLFLSVFPASWWTEIVQMRSEKKKDPLLEVVRAAGGADPSRAPVTMIVVPSTPDMNQHNVSYYGRMNGGKLVGRQLGSSANDVQPLLEQGNLVLLAEGDQGSVRRSAEALDSAVRSKGIFEKTHVFPRKKSGSYSLWRRKSQAIPPISFADKFSDLATGLADGVKGLEKVFSEVAVQHMLDGHFSYRALVREKALRELSIDSQDLDARWSLALLAVLENRPNEAAIQFTFLEKLIPENPWPSSYRSALTLVGWNPWEAAAIAENALREHPESNLLMALRDLSSVLGGSLWRLPAAFHSVPKAFREVEQSSS